MAALPPGAWRAIAMSTTHKLMTADDFFRMPKPEDGSRYELIRGELAMMTPASPKHGQCCLAVGAILRDFAKRQKLGWVASNDSGVVLERDPDSVRGADVAFWSLERLPELPNRFTEVMPDLAVEVVSPSDTHRNLLKRVLDFLQHGVRMVWVVDPDQRIATVYRSRHDVCILEASEEIDGGDVLPGFTSRVSEFFDE